MKVVSPDWILDSIEANARVEEELYHPSGLKVAEGDTLGAMEVCNGGVPSMESEATSKRSQSGVTVGVSSAGEDASSVKDGTKCETKGASSNVSESGSSAAPPPGPPTAPPTKREGVGGSSAEAVVTPASPTPVARAEQLLDGVVIYFTDYQDCVEDETLDKWKLVSERGPLSVAQDPKLVFLL